MENKRLSKKELNVVPEKGETYFYLFSDMVQHRYEIKESLWLGGMTDIFRLSKGNVFTDLKEIRDLAVDMNRHLRMTAIENGVAGMGFAEGSDEETTYIKRYKVRD